MELQVDRVFKRFLVRIRNISKRNPNTSKVKMLFLKHKKDFNVQTGTFHMCRSEHRGHVATVDTANMRTEGGCNALLLSSHHFFLHFPSSRLNLVFRECQGVRSK